MSILEGRFSPDSAGPAGFSIRSPSGCACALDGRLDNRADLLRELGEVGPVDWSAARIALRLFEKGGWSALSKLVGDWSAMLWDPSSRTVVLAKDYAGVRPLYYAVGRNGEIAWSSSLERLARSRDLELNDDFLVEYASRGFAATNTPYRNVFRVRPGHAVLATGTRIESRSLWALPVESDLQYPKPEDYSDHLKELFLQAVETRLAASGRTVMELSGGLDSSSVVCAACAVRPAGDARDTLTTLSYDDEESLDRKYIGLVEDHCRLPSIHLPIQNHPFVQAEQVGNAEPLCWQPRLEEVSSRMRDMGSNVLLTGRMGDLIMGNWVNDVEQVADRLVLKQVRSALRDAAVWSRCLNEPVYSVVWQAVQAACGRGFPAVKADATNSLSPASQRRAIESIGKNTLAAEWRSAPPSRRKKLFLLRQLLDSQSLECPEPLQPVSVSHPFADRRLVAFMLRVPAPLVCGPAQPRLLMRRSFASFLPPKVLARRSKAAYCSAFHRALIPMAEELLPNLSRAILVQRGIVDQASWRNRLVRFAHGLECNSGQLRNLIILEFWLRRFESGTLSFQHHTPASRPETQEPAALASIAGK